MEIVERISYDVIWASYDDVLGVKFSDSIRSSHSPAEFTVLHECQRCLIQFFDPATPGDPEFYSELSRAPSVPYHDDRWEFAVVAQQLSAGQNVLDIGAGPGWFLDQARLRGCEVRAVEHNPGAIRELETRGIETFKSIDSLRRANVEIDVVSAFHIIEHVPDVASFFEEAKRVLRPGGAFFVSAPNRARSVMDAFEPLDMPPHHLTRWSTAALQQQAKIHGLDLLSILQEPPDVSALRSGIRTRVDQQLGRVLSGQAAWFFARAAGKLMARNAVVSLTRRNGRYIRYGLFGHSLLARYRKPFPAE